MDGYDHRSVPLRKETLDAIEYKRQLERDWEEYGDPEDKRELNRQKRLVSRLVAEDRGAYYQELEQQAREAAARKDKANKIRRLVARTDDETLCHVADTMAGVLQMMNTLAIGGGGGGKKRLGGGGKRAIQW